MKFKTLNLNLEETALVYGAVVAARNKMLISMETLTKEYKDHEHYNSTLTSYQNDIKTLDAIIERLK